MNLQLRLPKALLLFTLLTAFAFKSKASITTSSVSGTYQCGSTITVSFSSSEAFGSMYYLQISVYSDMHDMLGPLNNIGGGSTSKNPITGSLANVTPGTYYARVICYNPGPIVYGSISGPFTVGAAGSSLSSAINAGTINCNIYSDTKTNSSTYCYVNNYDINNNSTQTEGQTSRDVWYKFTIASASSISISTCASALNDTYVHLLNSDGSHRESRDDYGPVCSSSQRGSLLYTGSNVLPAGTYYIVVEGFSDYEGSITTTITGICPAPLDPTASVSANGEKAFQLQLYPNPFANSTTLKVEGSNGNAELEITNINGAVVYLNKAYHTAEAVTLGENFPAGIYFVRVSNNNQSKILKLVKVN